MWSGSVRLAHISPWSKTETFKYNFDSQPQITGKNYPFVVKMKYMLKYNGCRIPATYAEIKFYLTAQMTNDGIIGQFKAITMFLVQYVNISTPWTGTKDDDDKDALSFVNHKSLIAFICALCFFHFKFWNKRIDYIHKIAVFVTRFLKCRDSQQCQSCISTRYNIYPPFFALNCTSRFYSCAFTRDTNVYSQTYNEPLCRSLVLSFRRVCGWVSVYVGWN